METVFVVETGEQHEGGSVVSIHRTLDGARAAALAVPCHFDGGWVEQATEGSGRWVNGCDYVKVVEVELSP